MEPEIRRCATYRPVLDAPVSDPERSFAVYVPMLTAWRRLPYLDPGLPLEHLPADWSGIEAGEVFTALDGQLREPAHQHAAAILHS